MISLKSVRLTVLLIFLTIFLNACNSEDTMPLGEDVSGIATQESSIEAGGIDSKQGGILNFPIAEEPPTLNPYLSQTGWEALITRLIYEDLATVGPDGNFYPVLAEDIPTRENGGVSEDGLTVTWNLRQDIFWTDGEPFTAEDVKFTWEAVNHPESGATYAPGADMIESVEVSDDYTVVIEYEQHYPDYLGQFSSTSTVGQGILPEHACGEPAEMQRWDCNRNPVGTGPFSFEEWESGQFIKISRNPRYHEEDAPHLESILFPIVPEPEVQRQMMIQGESDVWWEFDQQFIEEFSASEEIQINPGSEQWLLRLFFNLSEPGTGDPEKVHPILADSRVRQAIRLAIDRDLINKGVYGGAATPATHELYHGVFTCPEPESVFDPEAAKSLLEAAGWVDTDGDGVRDCQGCLHANEGETLSLIYRVSSDNQPYAQVQQLIVDMLFDVGINVEPQLAEGSVHDSLAFEGDFDLLSWSDGYEPTYDPKFFLETYYASWSIPPDNWNITRFQNEQVDELMNQLESTTDQETRRQIYCQIEEILDDEVPVMYLLVLPFPSAFSTRVQGWEANPNATVTWDAANWWLKE